MYGTIQATISQDMRLEYDPDQDELFLIISVYVHWFTFLRYIKQRRPYLKAIASRISAQGDLTIYFLVEKDLSF